MATTPPNTAQQPAPPSQAHVAVASGHTATVRNDQSSLINRYTLIALVSLLFFISGLSFWLYVEFFMQ